MPHVKGASRGQAASSTTDRLIAAATDLLATRGFARTTTRAIGETAGCNPALVAYHFGSLNRLLLAALDASSHERLQRYRAELATVDGRSELRESIRRLYRQDCDSGHVTVLAEMVAGGLMDRDLGREVARRVEPWVELANDTVRKMVPTATLRRRVPTRHLGYAIVASFLGLEILGQLTGDHRNEAVVDHLTAAGSWWQATTPASQDHHKDAPHDRDEPPESPNAGHNEVP